MATVKEIREERQNGKASKDNLKTYVRHYFENIEKLTVGEDAAFRSELRNYSESLGMNKNELNAMCAECAPKA